MIDNFTFKIERAGNVFIGSCVEVPGAIAQAQTLMACSRNLVQAIALILKESELPATTKYVEVEVAGQTNRYKVESIESLEGFAVSCPDLAGCYSQGDDEEEALENIRSAIKDYLEVAAERESRTLIAKVA